VRYPDCTLSISPLSQLTDSQVGEIVASQGYQASPYQFSHKGQDFQRLLVLFVITALCTLPMLLGMLFHIQILHDPYVQLALSTPPFIIALRVFGVSAVSSLRRRAPNMDVLVSMGILTSFLYSVAGMILSLGPDYLFFETSASIAMFVLLGNLLERRAILATRSALDDLHQLTPPIAFRIAEDGSVLQVPAATLKINDSIRLVSGDRLPADVIVTSGQGLVDESHMSGESRPLERGVGDELFAGTIINQGNFDAQVRASGEETVLAEIVRSVEEALQSQPPVQRTADRVARYFVPLVFGIAVLTLTINLVLHETMTESVLRAIAVLVIACPCAVGLATPTAVMVGLGRMAGLGILCRSGASLERFAKVQHIAFDKTGTLTLAQLKIRNFVIVDHHRFERIAPILKSIAGFSRHPYSQALATFDCQQTTISEADTKPLSIAEVIEHRGLGLEIILSDQTKIKLGSAKILKASHSQEKISTNDLFLLEGDYCIAAFEISETVRPEVPQVIAELRAMQIGVSILSGDRRQRVEHIAEQLKVDQYSGELSPLEKVSQIQKLSKTTMTAFVGDGINDGPALTAADVGISLGGGSQVSLNSAQILFLDGGLKRFKEGIALARATLRTIHENLFWAFFYNTCAIPIAAAGYLSPMLAAFTMAFSDIVVIGNSMRLKKRSSRRFVEN
jgi:Cu+-exporting ATPase